MSGLLLVAMALAPALGPARADELLPSTPEAWRFERLDFPLSFAPDIEIDGVALAGFEELRFAPGMFEAGAEDYFSYALALSIEGDALVDREFLQHFLERYYRGLCAAVGAGENLDLSRFSVALEPVGGGYRARIEMVDPFVTKAPVTLDLSLSIDPRPGRTEVLGVASPAARDAAIWRELGAIEERWRSARKAALFFNHLYVIPDAETYRALVAAEFLRTEFAVAEERTTVRRDMTYSGLYLYGRSTYFEFLPPTGPLPEGASGLAFGVDVEAGLAPHAAAWQAAGVATYAGPVTRRLGDEDLPWFEMLAAPPLREGSKLNVFAMEYDARFLARWHADLPPQAGGVTRAAVLARYAAHSGRAGDAPLFGDIVEASVEVDAAERSALVQLARASGYEVTEGNPATTCNGPRFRLVLTLAADSAPRGITSFRMSLTRPCEREPLALGRAELVFEGTSATMRFER